MGQHRKDALAARNAMGLAARRLASCRIGTADELDALQSVLDATRRALAAVTRAYDAETTARQRATAGAH